MVERRGGGSLNKEAKMEAIVYGGAQGGGEV